MVESLTITLTQNQNSKTHLQLNVCDPVDISQGSSHFNQTLTLRQTCQNSNVLLL